MHEHSGNIRRNSSSHYVGRGIKIDKKQKLMKGPTDFLTAVHHTNKNHSKEGSSFCQSVNKLVNKGCNLTNLYNSSVTVSIWVYSRISVKIYILSIAKNQPTADKITFYLITKKHHLSVNPLRKYLLENIYLLLALLLLTNFRCFA